MSEIGNLRVARLGIVFVLLLGCRAGEPTPDGMPELFRVRLSILQEGQPLADASVRLIPEDATSPWSSGGSTDSRGVAVIRTHGKYAGVPAGSYSITVSKVEMPAARSVDQDPLEVPPNQNDSSYDLVPPEFSDPAQTPLRLEVSAGKDTYESFDLGPAVRIERKAPGLF